MTEAVLERLERSIKATELSVGAYEGISSHDTLLAALDTQLKAIQGIRDAVSEIFDDVTTMAEAQGKSCSGWPELSQDEIRKHLNNRDQPCTESWDVGVYDWTPLLQGAKEAGMPDDWVRDLDKECRRIAARAEHEVWLEWLEEQLQPSCDQCQMVTINGVACHEHGCPKRPVECRECGAPFVPDRAGQRECQDCSDALPL